MSRFDRLDPSLDRDYCDGLAPDYDADTVPTALCYWCNAPYTDLAHVPYCSSLCGHYADRDNLEDRP